MVFTETPKGSIKLNLSCKMFYRKTGWLPEGLLAVTANMRFSG